MDTEKLDKVTGKKVLDVRFNHFLFDPNFNKKGNHEGKFQLCAYWKNNPYCDIITPNITNIFVTDGVVYFETRKIIFRVQKGSKIEHLEEVMRYLNDKEYTTSEFCKNCAVRETNSAKGLKVY